jgi:hypothetical protein
MGSQSAFQVAPFVADVTPRLGDTLVFGLDADSTVAVIEHPLLAKGVVLRDAGGTYVLCALDWCTLGNDAYDLFRARIARAAGTSPSHVAVHTVQQHTAPGVDINAQRLLDREKDAPRCTNPDFLEAATERVAAAVHGAEWRRVTHVGTSWAAVDRVASSRRLRQPDGTILARYSRANDPAHRMAPEGYIDGFLRTISFCDGEAPIVQMHYYATHPQSYYGNGRVTYDVPGLARERLEKDSGVFQIYFSGCAGDITMGKYNAGTPEDRAALADRLHDAMVRSVNSVSREPVSPLEWRTVPVQFPLRSDPAFSEETNRAVLRDAGAGGTREAGGPGPGAAARVKAALNLAFIERVQAGHPLELSCLALGGIRILHLPGEPFVEYQLWAQRAFPQWFVAVADLRDCATLYLCTDEAYRDNGGYEQTMSFVDPCEILLKRKMEELVTGRPTA